LHSFTERFIHINQEFVSGEIRELDGALHAVNPG